MDEEGLEETPPPMPGVLSDTIVAFLAGSDSTVTTLTCLFYLLIKHPEKYQRLREEVDCTTGYAFDTAANANMPYLNAVMYCPSCFYHSELILLQP
jgi:cytochrome P450